MIDNCEHLVGAVAAVVARVLGKCERILVLAASRERLSVEGETRWRLPPMMLPETTDAAGSAASTDACSSSSNPTVASSFKGDASSLIDAAG